MNGIVTHQEWLPTFLAAAGEPDIVDKQRGCYQAGEKHFHVHIDGANTRPKLTGEMEESPHNRFFYANDDGQVVAIRIDEWKIVFLVIEPVVG